MPGDQPQWVPRVRDDGKERGAAAVAGAAVAVHPLVGADKGGADKGEGKAAKKEEAVGEAPAPAVSNPLDPLSAAVSAGDDPLSAANPLGMEAKHGLAAAGSVPALSQEQLDADAFETFTPWAVKKPSILQKYTTTENIPVQASFMASEGPAGQMRVPVDKVKSRLEKLEEQERQEEQEVMNLSQKDYIAHIEALNDDLATAWNNEERVRALKLAIQSAKLLNDTSVIRFYPSKFVLVTEILDTFGRLVFERIRKKSQEADEHSVQGDDFSAAQVAEQAKETCRNWFFKIASIRELVPRILVEMSIIRCYKFLADNEFPMALRRLCSQIRGIGDPLVALYARAYLSRKGYEVAMQNKDYLLTGLYDFLFTQRQLQTDSFRQMLTAHNLSLIDYHNLYVPGVEWILQCIAFKAPQELFLTCLKQYKECSNNGLILNSIISEFSPEFICDHAVSLCNLIRECDELCFPKHRLYATLGVNLVLGQPQKGQILPILNEVWKVVTKVEDPRVYVSLSDVYVEYALKHCSKREVNTLLGDLLKHVKPNNAYESLQPQLQSIAQKILLFYPDFTEVLLMDKFMPLLDLFVGDHRIQVYRGVLESFCNTKEASSDLVLIHTMFDIGKALHDTLNSLSFEDDVRQVSLLINSFISKISFGRDVEAQLNFYVECRQSFAHLDAVNQHLVQAVCGLAMRTLQLARGRHTKKTAAFVRACIAYSFITIPSIQAVFTRLYLYMLAGQVALMNQSLTQAEAMFKAAITLVKEVPVTVEQDRQVRLTEDSLVAFLSEFAGTLVVVPGHPEHGPLYLVNGLLNVIQEYPWEKGSDGRLRASKSMIALLCAYRQEKLPYHIAKLDSNDVLFGGDPQFHQELSTVINQLVDQMLGDLALLGAEENSVAVKKKQHLRALDMFERLVTLSDLTPRSMTLALNLFTLAKKGGVIDKARLSSAIALVSSRESPEAAELAKRLSA